MSAHFNVGEWGWLIGSASLAGRRSLGAPRKTGSGVYLGDSGQ